MSPRKLRLVVPLVRNLPPGEALEVLPHVGKRAAEPIARVIKTAIANAKEKKIDVRDLIFKDIQINEGPRLKRWRPGARGRIKPYKRRMSHIRVVLETKEPEPIKQAREKTAADKGTTGSKSTTSTTQRGIKSKITDRLRKGERSRKKSAKSVKRSA